jgi:hypothetical protein
MMIGRSIRGQLFSGLGIRLPGAIAAGAAKAGGGKRKPRAALTRRLGGLLQRGLFGAALSLTLACGAIAQTPTKLAPLPSGTGLVSWLRIMLAEALDGAVSIEPVQRPATYAVRFNQPSLPFVIISATELTPAPGIPSAADTFARDFRAHCGTWRPLAEKTEGQLTLGIWGIDCPAMPSGGLYYWLMFFQDADRLQMVSVGTSLPLAARVRERFNNVAHGFGLPLYPEPRSLAEAMIVQQLYGGETMHYSAAGTNQPSADRAVHRTEMLPLTGRPGEYVVEAPSCSAVLVRVFEDGPPRRVISEERIDLVRLGSLVTRDGLHFRLRAGRYGERVSTMVARNPPIVDTLEVQDGEMPPSASEHPIIESLLDVHDRFCASRPRP